ncbi:glycosyltransferase family 4 protein [Pseudoalteromonas sp. SG45-5]|uniref:VpsD family glycosyltransferase n=1 Tax=unclassified Pseudoalteromonas TaxID=194690 RepID=UPI0015FE58B4|nr:MULTISPECIES: VpsD family glycosyltransferase [unclassified Pseudoalteromonas]MBB1384770.1 glycosyltransferase family 4 protein [Pseudoalteromonas sp. SG45-5]MBB1392579.1 glycosyltransferase family 4 protein [Pseudoalteromonas sp. SG44-4]MBB1449109.1 glycosyltransferase family 4 protein [Pseudoalteromonas sp. SG41-6]
MPKQHIVLIMPLSAYEWGTENCGGVDSVCQMLGEYLVSQVNPEFKYTIIGLDPQSKTPYTGEVISLAEHVDFIWLPCSSKHTGFKIPGIVWQNWHIRKLLKKLKPVLVHTHFWSSLIGSGYNGNTIVTVHSYKKIARRNVGLINNFLYEKVIPQIIKKRNDHVVVVGKQLQRALLKDGFESEVIHNPIDQAYFNAHYIRNEQKSIKLVTCALLTPRKKVEHSINLLSRFVDAGFNATLTVIGPAADNVYTEQLKKQVSTLGLENKVNFLGKLNKVEIVEQYQSADLGIFTSSEETFGLVPLEMLAVGLPLITTEVGILEDEKVFFERMGVLYLSDSLTVKDIQDMLTSHNIITSKSTLESKFNTACITQKYIDLYTSILDKQTDV